MRTLCQGPRRAGPDPSYLQRGRNGAIYSVHAPGLPLLLAPAFAVAGYRGAVAALILIAVGGAWLTGRGCWLVTEDAVASWVGWLAVIGSAPVTLSGSRPAGLTLPAGASRALVIGPDRGRLRVVTQGGFRPSQALPDSTDQRWLGVSVRAVQNRATAIR